MKNNQIVFVAIIFLLAISFSQSTYSFDGKADAISGSSYIDYIVTEVSEKYGVNHLLVHAIIHQESAYNIYAVSNKGAQGLMQLMPATQRDLGVKNPFDPWQNIDGGVRYILEQLLRFGSLDRALGAYNSGPHREFSGKQRPRETRTYIAKVNKEFMRLSQEQK